jgi:hypothetical protein
MAIRQLASASLKDLGEQAGGQVAGAGLAQPAAQVAQKIGTIQTQGQHTQQQPSQLQAEHRENLRLYRHAQLDGWTILFRTVFSLFL